MPNLNMPSQVSLKISLLMLIGGLVFAVGAAFLLNFIVSGPKLGHHYDFLLGQKSPVVSREILIINTEEYIDGSDFFLVLMTLTEMDASSLVKTGRLSPSATPITVTESEIRRRFYDEYNLIGSNIKNLFEGIRLGSVSPLQAHLFVDQLVELTEQGRDRLITALVDRDEDLIRSVAVFGSFIEAYTRVQVDSDGKLRRVKPIDAESSLEHPVYQYLKNRYAFSRIEHSGGEQILWLRSHDGKDLDIPLDKNGNIIAAGSSAFRRIDIEYFRKYDELVNAMLDALEIAHRAGMFSGTVPERIPLFLGDYAYSILEELLQLPSSENRASWKAARAVFFESLEDFFQSAADFRLISEIESQIADTDPSNERVLSFLINRRDELAQSSQLLRDIYRELSVIHSKLKNELAMSLCIMGFEHNAEYSALLANAIITGSHVMPVQDRYVLFFSIAASFFILLIIFMMRPFLLLILGFVLSILAAAAFSWSFIYFSFWIDPIVILASSIAGIIVVFYCKVAYLNYRALSFRSAYKAAVPKNILQNLINHGRPDLWEVNVVYAAVIAIKDINLFAKEDNEKSKDAGKIKKSFYSMVKKAAFNTGAAIAGYEGDTVLVCFGSPLELKPTLTTYKWTEDGTPIKTYNPIEKACALVQQLMKNNKISWRFGIDAGECSFSWSPETGFSVSGRPAVRARKLVSKTARYQKRALITENINQKIYFAGNKNTVLSDDNELIYELTAE
jgi:hypothetical protein